MPDIELKPWKWGERHRRGQRRDKRRGIKGGWKRRVGGILDAATLDVFDFDKRGRIWGGYKGAKKYSKKVKKARRKAKRKWKKRYKKYFKKYYKKYGKKQRRRIKKQGRRIDELTRQFQQFQQGGGMQEGGGQGSPFQQQQNQAQQMMEMFRQQQEQRQAEWDKQAAAYQQQIQQFNASQAHQQAQLAFSQQRAARGPVSVVPQSNNYANRWFQRPSVGGWPSGQNPMTIQDQSTNV